MSLRLCLAPCGPHAPRRGRVAVGATAAPGSQRALSSSRSRRESGGDKRRGKPTARKRAPPADGGGGGSGRGTWHEVESAPAWRVFGVVVPADDDLGKDDYVSVHPALVAALARKLGVLGDRQIPAEAVRVVRKSFDARANKGRGAVAGAAAKTWAYCLDVDSAAIRSAGLRRLEERPGVLERAAQQLEQPPGGPAGAAGAEREPVVVVGSGPAGLWAALEMAEAGIKVVLLERGQPVEVRGRDIGALFVRRQADPESNLCFGEGGAGTWSDGKLTTRIGRNSDPVRRVLATLHRFGAPESVLVAGKPHLGTDRLVRILKAFREHLRSLGCEVRFGCRVEDLVVRGGRVAGVRLADGSTVAASRVVMAVGHSARDVYATLLRRDVALTPKPFAMGFRIEHPQALIDRLQYGEADAASKVLRGKGPYPVAEYRLAAEVSAAAAAAAAASARPSRTAATDGSAGYLADDWYQPMLAGGGNDGSAEGGAAAAGAAGGSADGGGAAARAVFSFCMCPGGQIVPTSSGEEELCINGMSFSRRDSKWANSALVVAVQPPDWQHLLAAHGPLAGVALQRRYEREAAARGGGGFVAPAQRVSDFLAARAPSGQLPASSYRLGVRGASLHDFYPPHWTAAFSLALQRFDRQLPGFASDEALLHAAETRTSAPVRVERHADSLQSPSLPGLYPCGEGAGYAGGIVSAAVDGLRVGAAVVAELTGQPPGGVAGGGFKPVKAGY